MRFGQVHRAGTLSLSLVMVIIGVALLAEAAAGVGSLPVRLLAGSLFVAAGVGRIYVERQRGAGADARRSRPSDEDAVGGGTRSRRRRASPRQRGRSR